METWAIENLKKEKRDYKVGRRVDLGGVGVSMDKIHCIHVWNAQRNNINSILNKYVKSCSNNSKATLLDLVFRGGSARDQKVTSQLECPPCCDNWCPILPHTSELPGNLSTARISGTPSFSL